MTLAKAIEAAREFILESYASKSACGCHSSSLPSGGVKCLIHKALAALPDKPKSEDELLLIVKKHVKGMANPEIVRATIQALKSAGVLFVKED